jgi:hypothetical protein
LIKSYMTSKWFSVLALTWQVNSCCLFYPS